MSLSDSSGSTTWFTPGAAPQPFRAVGVSHMVLLGEADDAGSEATGQERCTIIPPDAIARSAPSRLRSYLSGRHCAARALEQLTGVAPTVGRGRIGEPLWPAGIIGSITHSAAFAAAAVAADTHWRGLGIDCDAIVSEATSREIAERVLPEADAIRRLDAAAAALPPHVLVSLGFSAKESVFKCIAPLYGDYFEFDDVVVDALDLEGSVILVRLAPAIGARVHAEGQLTVHLALQPDQVFTAVRLAR